MSLAVLALLVVLNLKMSEEQQIQGPAMLAMTGALKAPPQRISKIGNDITLPVTFQLAHIVASLLGGLLGLFFMVIFVSPFFNITIMYFLLSITFGGFLGIIVVTWSPLKGESFAKWMGLSFNSIRADKIEIDGEQVKAYIGIAKLNYTAAGKIRIFPGAVNVPIGSVDDRGVFLTLEDKRIALIGSENHTPRSFPTISDGFDPVRPELTEFSDALEKNKQAPFPL